MLACLFVWLHGCGVFVRMVLGLMALALRYAFRTGGFFLCARLRMNAEYDISWFLETLGRYCLVVMAAEAVHQRGNV
jgi:hypothetical protein